MAASTESLNYVQKMFIAFLGRAGAPAGMEYYAALIDADEESGKAILFDDLFYSEQGQSLYSGKETYEIVDIIFNNVMGRSPETAGLIYWTNAIDDGDFNVAEAAAIIADSAANTAVDLAELEAKTTAADAVTAHLTANPDDVAGYQAGFDEARTSLGDVTAANVDDFDAAAEVAGVINGIGYGGARTLTDGNDTVVGTDAQEVVTGVVGTDATFAAGDAISDTTSGDADTLNISGDGAYNHTAPTTGVTGFEVVNLDLAKQADTIAFAVTNLSNDVETLNITVAETVDVVGLTVAGEQTATVTGDLAADITTTNVTNLTATTTGTGAYSITGDADLATVTTVDSNDAGVSITVSATTSTISVDGADGANDAATISAVGAVALDVNGAGGENIDDLTLSGNGAAVTYTLAGADAGSEYTITGDQDVTLSGANDAFDGNPLTDSSTAGSTTVSITSGNDANLESMGTLSGGVEIAGALGDSTITLAAGNTVTLSADQGNDITIDANDTTAGGTLTLNMNNDSTGDLTFTDIETVSLNTGATARSVNDITTGANDTLNVAGTNSFTVNDISAGAMSIDVSGAVIANDLTGTGATDSSISVEGDSITVNALDSSNSNDAITLTSTANDITVATTTDAGTGTVTVTSAGDLTTTGTVAGGDISLSGGAVTLDNTVTSAGTGDIALTSTNDAASSTLDGAITSGGDLTFTGGTWTHGTDNNDGDLAVTGTLTIAGSTLTIQDDNDVSADSILITGDGVVDLGNQVNTDLLNASAATNDIDALFDTAQAAGTQILTGSGADDITTNVDSIFSISTGDGNDAITITNADAVTVNGGAGIDTIVLTATTGTSTTGSTISGGDGADDITIANGVAVGVAVTVNGDAGGDTIAVNEVGNEVTVNGGAGEDAITLVAASLTTVNAGDDNDTITVGADSNAVIDAGDGTDTLVLASNDYSDDDLSFSNIEKLDITAGNDATLSASQLAGDNTFELVGSGNLTTSFITIAAETANDTVIDVSGVSTDVLTAASINIDGNDGDDTITHNAYSGTITGGAGNDTIDGKAGTDNITGGNGADTMTGGDGSDSFIFLAADNDVGIDVTNDSMDTITDFVTGADTIDISAIAAENDANDVSGTAANDVGEVFTLANDTLVADVTKGVIIVSDAMGTGDSYVYIDANNDGVLDDNDILIIIEDATPVTGDFI